MPGRDGRRGRAGRDGERGMTGPPGKVSDKLFISIITHAVYDSRILFYFIQGKRENKDP